MIDPTDQTEPTGPAGPAYRCSAASLERDEALAGTATHVRTWLLIEHAGPWGVTALRDARLPEGLGPRLQRLARTHKAKVLLIRRVGARRTPERPSVFTAYADPRRPRLERGTVGDLHEVLDLDLAGLRDGRGSGLDPCTEPLFAVCTNGRHDACCAERGRPVAQALDAARPEETWEVSHIGGDRFAANLVALPEGLYYGRLDGSSAPAMAATHDAGRLDLDHLRGRSSYAMPVQAAEIALLRHLGRSGLRDLSLEGVRRDDGDGQVSRVRFAAADGPFDVAVRTTREEVEPPARLTCQAARTSPVPRHEILEIVQG